ncbi:chromosome partitioning protein, ParB family [Caldanaerobius fijiensis DSM 17918]|uniref:Chromosome partitioning protein, ParB family n=1 Tax=Caldanaerobius fijiensis DSM 17918 TaxID=1121256 RepID=A0A1M5BLB3_9THEO|nr:ParB/RepB/Spo0J family partition protein [Caldanaerobius fijiensis]SHF43331.1 chromosome partitioning protein, ParB family [Caldanaerobius fijiensis DSM 17918]
MKMIDVSLLKEHPRNNELFDDIEGERWNEFVESIRTSGIIVPLIITQNYIVVSGNQRLRAAKEIGMKEVPCEVRTYENKDGLSKEDWILKDLIETNLRQRGIGNLNPMKTARCILELERIYGIKRGGYRENLQNLGGQSAAAALSYPKNLQQEIIGDMGISKRRYHELKKLNDLIPELQTLVESGKLSSTAGTQLAYLEPEQQRELYEALGEQIGSLKRSEIENIRKDVEKYKKQVDELAKQLLDAEKEKKQLEYMQKKLEEQLKNVKPEIIEKQPDDYIFLKKSVANISQQLEQQTAKLKQLEEEKEKLEKERTEYAKALQELKEANKKLQEQKERAEKQVADMTIAEIQAKNKHKVRQALSLLVGEINRRTAEIKLMMEADIANLEDPEIGNWIQKTIDALNESIEELERWNYTKEGRIYDAARYSVS